MASKYSTSGIAEGHPRGDIVVCVLSEYRGFDDIKMLCTLNEWERIEAAVKEYNETEF
jgi:hypothetical protein